MADSTHSITGIRPSLPYYMYGGTVEEPNVGQQLKADQAGRLPSDPAEARHQLIEAGRKFEAYFVSYLLKVMRETVPQGAIANKPGAYFHSFYDQEIGLRAAESGGIGITAMIQDYAKQNLAVPSRVPQVSPVNDR